MKKILLLFLAFVSTTPALGVNLDGKDFLESWKRYMGLGNSDHFGVLTGHQETNIPDGDDPCIGEIADGASCSSGKLVSYNHWDEWGKNLMVAVDATDGGAYFCPVTVVGANTNGEHDTYMSYYQHSNISGGCVWLCHKGYTGDRCDTYTDGSSGIQSCDSNLLKKENYDVISGAGSSNVGGKVVAWYSEKLSDPAEGMNNTNDGLFVISGWLPNGHGAWVRPYVARVRAFDWNTELKSDIFIYPAVKEGTQDVIPATVGCLDGYEPNSDYTNCVPINSSVCGVDAGVDFCPGWKSQYYDTNESNKVLVGDCYQWRCKDPNYGFDSVNVHHDCGRCPVSAKQGIASDGSCRTCDNNQLFDATAETSGYCVDANSISWCTGWRGNDFAGNTNTLFQRAVNNCSQWRCTDNTKALSAPGSVVCVDCNVASVDTGINPDDGTCRKCPNGMIFDVNAVDAADKYCSLSWCADWDSSRFDSTKHVRELVGDCYQWRCKQSGYALTARGGVECEKFSGARRGVNPESGLVVECPNGKRFNSKAVYADNKYCEDTISLDMDGLANGNKTGVDSCWTSKNKKDYANCMKQYIKSQK